MVYRIGGLFTRAGALAEITVSRDDRETLARFDLRLGFVGIHGEVVKVLTDGNLQLVEQALVLGSPPGRHVTETIGRPWVIPLGNGTGP